MPLTPAVNRPRPAASSAEFSDADDSRPASGARSRASAGVRPRECGCPDPRSDPRSLVERAAEALDQRHRAALRAGAVDAQHRADGFGLVHHVAYAATMGRAYGDDF